MGVVRTASWLTTLGTELEGTVVVVAVTVVVVVAELSSMIQMFLSKLIESIFIITLNRYILKLNLLTASLDEK